MVKDKWGVRVIFIKFNGVFSTDVNIVDSVAVTKINHFLGILPSPKNYLKHLKADGEIGVPNESYQSTRLYVNFVYISFIKYKNRGIIVFSSLGVQKIQLGNIFFTM